MLSILSNSFSSKLRYSRTRL